MREDPRGEITPVLTWLTSALIAGAVLQLILPLLGGTHPLEESFGLSIAGLRAGRFWTLLTHAFLHDSHFVLHAMVNIAALFLLGRELAPRMGGPRFFGLFAGATVVGGAVWGVLHWHAAPAIHVGASAAIGALVVVFACFSPERPIRLLLFFFVPFTFRPRQAAVVLVGTALLGLFCYELPGNELPFNLSVAGSALLGGMLTGYLYYRIGYAAPPRPAGAAPVRPPASRAPADDPAFPGADEKAAGKPGRTRREIQAEVDRILDKINCHGLASLTPDERRMLDSAKDLMSRS